MKSEIFLLVDSNLDIVECAERKDLQPLNFGSPVMDLELFNLKSPVTDGIIDISDSPDWQGDITWYFFSYTLFLTGAKYLTNNMF